MRNYVGPLDDCNGNTVFELEELLDGRAVDCNYNGIVDTCDITADPSLDSDGDGAIDACCRPAVPIQPINVYPTNRYLIFEVPDSPLAPLSMQGDQQNFPTAIRVTFIPSSLQAETRPSGSVPCDDVSDKTCFHSAASMVPDMVPRGLKSTVRADEPWVMWVGRPSEVRENGGSVDPLPDFGTFMAATLQCTPYYHDFGSIDELHVFREAIIPDGRYETQTIRQGCGSSTEFNFSPPLAIDTSK